jgi:protein-S-isoprenylcysteine O-methyltransferase Ste14
MVESLIGRLVFIAISSSVIIAAAGGRAFLHRPVGLAYLALWAVWWLATALGRSSGVSSAHDRKQRAMVVISGFLTVPLLIIAPPWEYAHFGGPLPRDGSLSWFGLVLFAGGIALQSSAMLALHGLYTVRLGVQPGHRLVTSGPYRWVRHPGYLSYLLSLIGIGLALSSLIGLALTAWVLPFILWRIKSEELMLLAEFGDKYQTYSQQTKRRLIPLLY